MLQEAFGASEKAAMQSAGVPLPSTWAKSAETLKPGEMAVSVSLPVFSICIEIAPSVVSVVPSSVAVATVDAAASP